MAEKILWYGSVGTVPLSKSTASVPVKITVRPYWAAPGVMIDATEPGTAVSEGDAQWTYTGLPVPPTSVKGLQFGYNVSSYPKDASYICAVRLVQNRTPKDRVILFEETNLHLSSADATMYTKSFPQKTVAGALTLERQVVLGGSTSNRIFLAGIGITPGLI